MNDHFRVTLGVKNVAQRPQFSDELAVVINFTVKNHHHRAIFIEQGLLPGGNVNNGQPSMTQAKSWLHMQAAFVRAAMLLRVVHALQLPFIDCTGTVQFKNSGDSTHGSPKESGKGFGKPPPWSAS